MSANEGKLCISCSLVLLIVQISPTLGLLAHVLWATPNVFLEVAGAAVVHKHCAPTGLVAPFPAITQLLFPRLAGVCLLGTDVIAFEVPSSLAFVEEVVMVDLYKDSWPQSALRCIDKRVTDATRRTCYLLPGGLHGAPQVMETAQAGFM
jgi:hypothetical protein